MDLYTTMTGIPKTFREFRDEELTYYFICFFWVIFQNCQIKFDDVAKFDDTQQKSLTMPKNNDWKKMNESIL